MEIKSMQDMIDAAKELERKVISVACCSDEEVLEALEIARSEGIADSILIGDKDKTLKIMSKLNIDKTNYEFIDILDKKDACRKAVELVSSKRADAVMKGLVDTSVLLKAVLDKEIGLRTGKVLSHTALLEIPNFDRLLYLTDGAMNIAPSLDEKKQIIENSVEVAHALGNSNPKVGLLAAIEKVNPKMVATTDAFELEEMNKKGIITGCEVGGPLSLDISVSIEAAKHKGNNHKLAGIIDILVVPFIEAGNVLYKSIIYLANGKSAGIITGAKAPVILTSRADSKISKFQSIALAMLVSENK